MRCKAKQWRPALPQGEKLPLGCQTMFLLRLLGTRTYQYQYPINTWYPINIRIVVIVEVVRESGIWAQQFRQKRRGF